MTNVTKKRSIIWRLKNTLYKGLAHDKGIHNKQDAMQKEGEELTHRRRNISTMNHASKQAPPAEPARFLKPVSDEEIQRTEESCIPKSTNNSTNWAMKLWEDWAKNRKSLEVEFPAHIC